MTKLLKRTPFVLAAALFAVGCSQSGPTPTATPVATPVFEQASAIQSEARVAAVMVHANWCASCRIFEPKLTSLKEGGPIDGVQFITLDYTARDKDAFFAQADELGIGAPIRAQLKDGVITGIMLLVDLDDQKIIADLRKELSPQQLRTQITQAAQSA